MPRTEAGFVGGGPGVGAPWLAGGSVGLAGGGSSVVTPLSAQVIVHLRRARDLMDARFAEALDLDAMAAAAGFSRYHFAREFRAAFGEPPGAYLSRRRVERAKDLLVSVNLTVTEVCVVVGFSSLSSFIRRFSELVGCSPSVYRRTMIQNGGRPPVPGCFVMAWGRPAIPDKAAGGPGS